MGKGGKKVVDSDDYSGPMSYEDHENYLISLAKRQAEKQLREGTAPAQVVTHYLKMGSVSERLKQENLRTQVELNQVKAENIRLASMVDTNYQEIIDALTIYSGGEPK